jgi:glycosyltransferase involved in cell wall biosynthesis
MEESLDLVNPAPILPPSHQNGGSLEHASSQTRRPISICVPIIKELTFIAQDVSILKESFEIRKSQCSSLSQMIATSRIASTSDITFCWFGSVRFMLPVFAAKLFRRRVVIVAGGYDVANVPEIPYGNMARFHSRLLGRLLFKLADQVLAVSRSARNQTIHEAGVTPSRVRIAYNAVDHGKFLGKNTGRQRVRRVLLIANVFGDTYERKNIDYALQVAKRLSDLPFLFAGVFDSEATRRFKAAAPPNAHLMGSMSQAQLADLYGSSLIYFQPSLHESFGCAVAEAMMCGCIPIVSNSYALPEVVGDSGILIDPRDTESSIQAIRSVLNDCFRPSEDASDRVKRMFSIAARAQILKTTLSELAQTNS